MSFPRYPEYKDSGVEWLGEVPAHWNIGVLARVTTRIVVGIAEATTHAYSESGIPILRAMNIRSGKIIGDMIYIHELFDEDRKSKQLHEGDLVTVRTGNAGVTAIIPKELEGCQCFTMLITTLQRNRFDSYFACYWMNSNFSQMYFSIEGWGTAQINISVPILKSLPIFIPTLSEQQAIASFLDRETAKIDALVEEQKRLIELLKEKRQAVISHAVTKGLDPNAKMKDSGVEWLGMVPEGWEVKRVRYVAKLNPSKSEISNLEKETIVSFLPMEAIGDDGSINLDREKAIAEVETGYTYFKNGDVTIAKITPCYENGKGAVMHDLTNGIGFGTTELVVLRPFETETTGLYLHWIFVSTQFRKIGESHMYGAGGQKRVPDDFVRNFELAIPSLEEQSKIISFLVHETQKFEKLTLEAQRVIDILQERRTALISAAVTGKIDVRDLTPNPSPERRGEHVGGNERYERG